MPKRKRVVPPPPAALISLLQSDAQVLDYFTALQENLVQDTATWKSRAKDAQAECLELKKQLAAAKKKNPVKRKAPDKKKKVAAKNHDANDEPATTSKPSPTTAKKKKPPKKPSAPARTPGVEIDDDMLENMFSSDDEDEEEEQPQALAAKKPPGRKEPAPRAAARIEIEDDMLNNMFSSDEEEKEEQQLTSVSLPYQDVYLSRLEKASQELEILGVSLVEGDNTRRPDVDVVKDIMYTLRCIARLKSPSRPFENDVPACDLPEHVAYTAKVGLFSILCTMDVFCSTTDDDEWKQLTANAIDDEDEAAIQIGMYNRAEMVQDFMASLNGEISESWAVADRTARLVSTAQRFGATADSAEVRQEEENQYEYGAKSHVRLANLVERILLVQLLCHYHDLREESEERIHLVLRYILSTAPFLSVEDYPTFPPVLDMVIVEAMLVQRPELGDTESSSVFEDDSSTLQVAALAIHVSALIWRQRLGSSDDRITDVCRVQLASYERIQQLGLSWFGVAVLTQDDVSVRLETTVPNDDDVIGQSILEILQEQYQPSQLLQVQHEGDDLCNSELSLCVTRHQLEIRQLDHYRSQVGGHAVNESALNAQDSFLSHLEEKLTSSDPSPRSVSIMAKCCLYLSNALYAARLMRSFLENDTFRDGETIFCMKQLGSTPVIRYINLKRRSDRSNAFQAQAKIEKLLIVKAIVKMDGTINDTDNSYFWGDFAYDSRDKHDISLDHVATHWRPFDLRAFDKDAKGEDELVRTSDSERSCALSHISSWTGVRRSLESSPSDTVGHDQRMLRLFRISGFASGAALLPENEHMPPVPVCVIVEDDAVLVDRFSDRLNELLEELPRDFHFCSLGYSRPKPAPVLSYSQNVGIPTCIWYLTGYILSLEGSQHLAQSLPVRGPVDSWIGLKMCANWDNNIGQAVGVGMAHVSHPAELPSRKQLCQILKFRAFCASTPLCSQRVGGGGSRTAAGRSWRHRDTDIVYSGN